LIRINIGQYQPTLSSFNPSFSLSFPFYFYLSLVIAPKL